jgi:cell division initiation protein
MPLTPLDIHNKEFSRSFRGFDEDEVNEFLDLVIRDYDTVMRAKKDLEDQVEELKNQVLHFSQMEGSLNRTILIAQETADEVKTNAQKEAKLIVREAEKNADRIITEALSKTRKLVDDLEEMKKQAKIFRSRFKMLMEAQLDLLKDEDWNHLLDFEIELKEIKTLEEDLKKQVE